MLGECFATALSSADMRGPTLTSEKENDLSQARTRFGISMTNHQTGKVQGKGERNNWETEEKGKGQKKKESEHKLQKAGANTEGTDV